MTNRSDSAHSATASPATSMTPPTTPAAPPAPPLATPEQPGATTRRRSAGHVVAIVLGCLALLPALGVLTGGVGIAIAKGVATDDDGYFTFTPDRVRSDGVAVVTDDLWFDEDAEPWVLNWIDLDVRLTADGAEGRDDVFVGVARSADVDAYLRGSRYSVIDDMDNDTPRYREERGEASVGSPGDQDFWVATASGSGEQQLDWEARGGRWTIVVMNADGSTDVAADVEIGAKSGALTPIMVVLLVAGGLGTLVSVGLIVFGVRGRKQPAPGSTGPRPPFTGTLPPPVAPSPHAGTASRPPESTTRPVDRTVTPVG